MQDSRVESRLDDGAGVVEPLGQPQPQPRQQTKEIVPPLKVNFSNEETNLVQTQARDRVDSSLRGTSPSPSPSAPSSSSVRRFKRSNSFADFADKITPRFIKSVSRKLEERAHKKNCRTHSLSLTPKDGSVHVDVSSDSEEEGKSVSRSSSLVSHGILRFLSFGSFT